MYEKVRIACSSRFRRNLTNVGVPVCLPSLHDIYALLTCNPRLASYFLFSMWAASMSPPITKEGFTLRLGWDKLCLHLGFGNGESS